MEIVTEFGFQNVTMSNILERAKAGTGTLYNYFSGKDDLISVLHDEIREKASKEILAGIQPAKGIRPRFEAFAGVYLDYCTLNLDEMNFIEQYGYYNNFDMTVNNTDALYNFVGQILKEGKDQLLVKDLREELLMQILSGLIMSVSRSVNSGYPQLSEAERKKVINSAWDSIKV